MYNLKAYLELIRYKNCFMAAVATLVGLFIAYNILSTNIDIFLVELLLVYSLLGFVAVFLITGAGNAINDYYDIDIDKINRPERPIPSGRIYRKKALHFSLILFFLGFIISTMINPICAIIALVNIIILYLYARSLKKHPLSGNISIGYLTGSLFLFGGGILGLDGVLTVFILFLLAALATLSREIIKDIEDIEGDKASGAKTLPIIIGKKNASYAATGFVIIAMIASPLPFFQSILNLNYLYVVSIANVVFLASLFELMIKSNPKKSSKLLKIGMLFALFAFIAGA